MASGQNETTRTGDPLAVGATLRTALAAWWRTLPVVLILLGVLCAWHFVTATFDLMVIALASVHFAWHYVTATPDLMAIAQASVHFWDLETLAWSIAFFHTVPLWLLAGLVRVALTAARNREARRRDLLIDLVTPPTVYLRMLVVACAVEVLLIVGLALWIVPGLVGLLFLGLVPFVVVDSAQWLGALARSSGMVWRHLRPVALLGALVTALAVPGALGLRAVWDKADAFARDQQPYEYVTSEPLSRSERARWEEDPAAFEGELGLDGDGNLVRVHRVRYPIDPVLPGWLPLTPELVAVVHASVSWLGIAYLVFVGAVVYVRLQAHGATGEGSPAAGRVPGASE